MKKYVLFCLFCLLPAALGADISGCTCNGKPLYGRVQVVEHFADFKVQLVTSFPDLRALRMEGSIAFQKKGRREEGCAPFSKWRA